MKLYFSLIIASVLTAFATIGLKLTADALTFTINPAEFFLYNSDILFNKYFWMTVICLSLVLLIQLYALKRREITEVFFVYVSITLVLVFVMSVVSGLEHFSAEKLIGLLCLVIAVYNFRIK